MQTKSQSTRKNNKAVFEKLNFDICSGQIDPYSADEG